MQGRSGRNLDPHRRDVLAGLLGLGAAAVIPAVAEAQVTDVGVLRRTIAARFILPQDDMPAELMGATCNFVLSNGDREEEVTELSRHYNLLRPYIDSISARDESVFARARTLYAADDVPPEFWNTPSIFYQHAPASVIKQLLIHCAADVVKTGHLSEETSVRYDNAAYNIPAVGLSWFKRRGRWRHLRANRIVGRQYSVGDLFESTAANSANDAAFLLARRCGQAIIENQLFGITEEQARDFARDHLQQDSLQPNEMYSAAFLLYMKQTSEALKMRSTNVVSVNGLPTEQMYLGSTMRRFSAQLANRTCAYDLMLLNKHMSESHGDFMERYGHRGVVLSDAGQVVEESELEPDDVGTQAGINDGTVDTVEERTLFDLFVKTGFTRAAGYCLTRLSRFTQRILAPSPATIGGGMPLAPAAEALIERMVERRACLIVLDACSRNCRDDISDDFTDELARQQARTATQRPATAAQALTAS